MTPPARNLSDTADSEVGELRRRLAEAEETLDALREGRVDALVVGDGARPGIITFGGAAEPYRAMIEAMQEGALTLSADGSIIYCNRRFAAMAARTQDQLIGQPVYALLDAGSRLALQSLLARMQAVSCYVTLQPRGAEERLAYVSANPISEGGAPHALVMLVLDVTEQHRTQMALLAAEQKYRGIFENAIEGLFQLAVDGRYLSANPALARIYGYHCAQELLRERNADLERWYLDPRRRAEFLERLRASGEVRDFEVQVRRKDKDTIWIRKSARAVFDVDGTISHFEGSVEDITTRKRYEEQLEYQSNFDTLTGLCNRRQLLNRLQLVLAAAERYGHRVAVAFIDLDQFKYINDTLGHDVGDQLLQVVAQRLKSCMREGDIVARQGGDEFVLVIDHANEFVISRIMPKILESVSRPAEIPGHDINVTCSIGFSLYPQDGAEAKTLLRHADVAMYRAKELGRNDYQFFTRELNEKFNRRMVLESRLRHALERGELFLEYQPQIDLKSRHIVGVEVLVRWRSPEEGTVAPAEFIPIAEDTGMISPIGEWILRSACAQNRSWQASGLPAVRVAVNLSARQFKQRELHERIRDILDETGLAPQFLELELTESALAQDVEAAIATLNSLKRIGVGLSIDDFGTGYSSLSHLKRFPIDALKIDQSFVRDITTDANDAVIAETIITLAHSLKLKVIAEGVETALQERFLQRRQCDEIQGFHYSRPMAAAECGLLLARSKARHAQDDMPNGKLPARARRPAPAALPHKN
jgi:diguanylate cyclase (GGDEF)-like protein/PAS domain S-box-containing protein